jgi:alpha-1,6-mannosyltransferase
VRPELAPAQSPPPRLRIVAPPPLRIVDVALCDGERDADMRAYLEAKSAYARTTGRFEHHLLTQAHQRLPIGLRALVHGVRRLRPDLVLVHEGSRAAPRALPEQARLLGARVVAVQHGARRRRAFEAVDAVMAARDPRGDCARELQLRLGLDAAFRPRPELRRGDHVLYVGRLARDTGVVALLEAAARSADPWPLRLIGDGPAEEALQRRVRRLGIEHRVSFLPFVRDREALARRYAQARCVVLPGEHETFGLAALEAAACGAPVVTCCTAPVARVLGPLAHRFRPGGAHSLAVAIRAARAARQDRPAAAELARRFAWERCFAAELADLEELLATPA